MHIGAQEVGSDETLQANLLQLLSCHKLVVVVDCRLLGLLELLSQRVQIITPFGRGAQRRNEILQHFGRVVGEKQKTCNERGACSRASARAMLTGIGKASKLLQPRSRLDGRKWLPVLLGPNFEHLRVHAEHELSVGNKVEIFDRQAEIMILDESRAC